MASNPIVKCLIKAKLTHASDGLLFDFCSKEKWKSATESCKNSIQKREIELKFLKSLMNDLEILEEYYDKTI